MLSLFLFLKNLFLKSTKMFFKNNEGLISGKLIGVMIVVLLFLFMVAYFFYGLEPTFYSDEPIKVEIKKGDSFQKISSELSSKNLVRSIAVFKLYTFLVGAATHIQPGEYTLATTMSVPEIVGFLIKGGKNEATVQIIEGETVKDIDEKLKKEGVLKEGSLSDFNFDNLKSKYKFLENVSSLEGFLFPDTYNFKINSNVEEVVVKMLNNFELKAWPLLETQENWYQKLILASYLEKEIKKYEDMEIAAGILLKRFKINMPLQVDATLSYAKCEGKFLTCDNNKREVLGKDKEIDSPFNTYKYRGFTPTPISNPGVNAIKAALQAKKSDYLYYCTSGEETFFSKSLEEHNKKCFK